MPVKTFQRKELEKLPMLVEMKLDQKEGIIVIKGERSNVLDAKSEIQKLLLRFSKDRHDTEHAKSLKDTIEWVYEELVDSTPSYKPYGELISYRMEIAYKNDEKTFYFYDKGAEYVIDFDKWEEYPQSDRANIVRVMRREVFKGLLYFGSTLYTGFSFAKWFPNLETLSSVPSSQRCKIVNLQTTNNSNDIFFKKQPHT